jgi:nitrite reductase/ring-hydroxylating ferredoxin subunit
MLEGVLTNNRLRCFAHGACFRVDTGDIEDHPGHGNLISTAQLSGNPISCVLFLSVLF